MYVTEVPHVQVEGGTGTHSLSEFRECGNGGERNDKGRAEQTGNYLKFCIIKVLFIEN